MVTIGPTRWFVRFSRQQQRGGRTQYDLSLVSEAKKYLISKVEYDGLEQRVVDAVVPIDPIGVTAWLNTWEAYGAEEARLSASLCQDLSVQAVGEALRLQLFRPVCEEKYARQLVVQQGLLMALQKPIEDMVQVEQTDIRADLLAVIEARRIYEEVRTREELELRMATRKENAEALKRSLELLFENLTPDLIEEAKRDKVITVKKGGDTWVVPVETHGMVKRYDKDGEYVGRYCLTFLAGGLPAGDEALMKYILIKSDLKRFLKTANYFKPER